MLDRAVKKSIIINALPAQVWDRLTDPDCIRKFLFNAEINTDWKQGSPIEFRGNWKGRDYMGKGEILSVEKDTLLEYSYYSNLSGQPDTPDNYCHVIYTLVQRDNQTVLSVTQTNVISQDEHAQVSEYWQMVLDKIKAIVESDVDAMAQG
jgi:uncharacterized protein YndB with AHSA1/START domain